MRPHVATLNKNADWRLLVETSRFNILIDAGPQLFAVLFLSSPAYPRWDFSLLNMAKSSTTRPELVYVFLAVCLSSRFRYVYLQPKRTSYTFLLLARRSTVCAGFRDVKKWSSRGLNVVSCGYKNKLLTVFHFFCWFVLMFFFSEFETWSRVISSTPDRVITSGGKWENRIFARSDKSLIYWDEKW